MPDAPDRRQWGGCTIVRDDRTGDNFHAITYRAACGDRTAEAPRRMVAFGNSPRAFMPMTVDKRHSPFYMWLDNVEIRRLVLQVEALPAGQRLVLIKGLIPGLVDAMGEAAVESFLGELLIKTRRFGEAVDHPGQGSATRSNPGEPLGGPVPAGEVHLPGTRNGRRPGGRAAEREWETALWEEVVMPVTRNRSVTSSSSYDPSISDEVDEASLDSFPASDPPAWGSLRIGPPRIGE